MMRRGRRLESDFGQRELEIAAHVHRTRHTNGTSIKEAIRDVAAMLDVSQDTVKRARRFWRNHPAKVASQAMALELILDTDRAEFKRKVNELAERCGVVKQSRGK